MQVRQVRLAPDAERDLERLSDWLADVASEATATRYVRQVHARLESSGRGSERGTLRDEALGLRVIGLMKSLSVAFTVDAETVHVQRVFYRGQDWQTDLTDDDTD